MKIKLIKIFTCFLIMCMCLLAFQIKPKAQSSNTTFEPFEVGMTFPVGYEITTDNLSLIADTKEYAFRFSNDELGLTVTQQIYYDSGAINQFWEYDNILSVGEYVGSSVKIGYGYDSGYSNLLVPEELSNDIMFELIDISSDGGSAELGIYTESVEEPNVIYSGTYELLANLIYGTTENLTSTQIGTVEFISMIITLLCVLLPFIILFFILRKLVD